MTVETKRIALAWERGLVFHGGAPDGPQVVNEADPNATIPLAAHVEYWENALLWRTLERYL